MTKMIIGVGTFALALAMGSLALAQPYEGWRRMDGYGPRYDGGAGIMRRYDYYEYDRGPGMMRGDGWRYGPGMMREYGFNYRYGDQDSYRYRRGYGYGPGMMRRGWDD